MKLTVQIRPATADDYGYVIHSGSREMMAMVKPKYRPSVQKAITAALDAMVRGAELAIACDAAEPTTCVGWAMGGARKTLLYVYVANSFRGHGIAKRLRQALEDS